MVQGVRNSNGVQLFRLVRVVSGEEDDLLKPCLVSSAIAALGTSAATGMRSDSCFLVALCSFWRVSLQLSDCGSLQSKMV
jgi:hypothetical protein